MPRCEKIKTDKVICDEIFFLRHEENDVPINFVEDIPVGSTIGGTVQVALSKCDVIVDDINDLFIVDLLFIVQKELTITLPDETEIPLEFVERVPFEVDFRKCRPSNLEILDITPDQLSCHIVRISGNDVITMNTDNDTFSEVLDIEIKIKILAEIQEFLALCPNNNLVEISVSN